MIIVVFFIIQRLRLQKIVYKNPFLKKTLDNVFCLHSGLVIKKKRSGIEKTSNKAKGDAFEEFAKRSLEAYLDQTNGGHHGTSNRIGTDTDRRSVGQV